MDLGDLKEFLYKVIVDKCDYYNLNDEVDFLCGIIFLIENLVIVFWNEFVLYIKMGCLYCVKFFEMFCNFVEYYGLDVF